jgi:hypothetical protein
MERFIGRIGRAVKGVLNGFDRIVFKGSILPLMYALGAMDFLCGRRVLNKDYKKWMMAQTEMLIDKLDRFVKDNRGCGITHLSTWRRDKDELARKRQKDEGIKSGLIGAWSCLESGLSYRAHYSPQTGFPLLRRHATHCKHIYLYFDHAQYGFMNVRLQTWFPYPIQVCMNGRHWLRRGLEKNKIDFLSKDNKFFHIADFKKAQKLLDRQLEVYWPRLLDGLLPIVFPTMTQTLGAHLSYYWTLWQSEWATDIIFNSASDLEDLMNLLVRHAMITGTGARLLRYFGRPLTRQNQPHGASNSEVYTRLMNFRDGVRLRHWVDRNSAKLYSTGNNLRMEMTMNVPEKFKVYRHAQGNSPSAKKRFLPLRKGVADIALRAQVSQEINNRFLNNLADFSDETPVRQLLGEVTRASTKNGRRVRALDPTGKDLALLEAIADPAFGISGLTNKLLRERLRNTPWGSGRTEAQLSARISRHLRLLRDHGLIRKTPNQWRYQVTPKGRQLLTALSSMLGASTQQLIEIAA